MKETSHNISQNDARHHLLLYYVVQDNDERADGALMPDDRADAEEIDHDQIDGKYLFESPCNLWGCCCYPMMVPTKLD
jgi:hypothetical protein